MRYICAVLAIVACLVAGTRESNYTLCVWDAKWHDINQVELRITNHGKFGDAYWPKETNHNYIFGAGIWFGAIDSLTGDTLVTIGYGPHGGECEFTPGLCGQDPNAPYVIIYMYPEPWPAPIDTFPMAPQDVVSHQDSWCCYNDCDSLNHVPGDTRPIGIEVYQTGYAWDKPEIEDIVFIPLEIKNVEGNYLKDCYISLCTDCDIGNEAGEAANDICTCIIERVYIIDGDTIVVDDVAYQWQEEEPGGPPWWPGVISFDLLQTPFDLVPWADKDEDGIPDQYERDSTYYWNNLPPSMWDVDNDGVPDWRDASENPQLGMTSFKRFSLALEPNLDPDRYLTMAGYNYITGEYEPYDTVIPQPDDQRFIVSTGPFDLAPDSSVTVVFAVLFAEWYDIYATPDTALALVDKWAQRYYDMYWFLYTGVEEHSSVQVNTPLKISPNPILRNTKVSFSLSKAGVVSLTLYDVTGRLVKLIIEEYRHAGFHTIDLNTHGLAQGSYFLVLETPDGKSSQSLVVLR